MTTFHELFGEYEKERLEQSAKENAAYDAPEAVAAREKRQKEEFDAGVRNGWWDENGTPIEDENEDDDFDDEDGEYNEAD